MADVSSYPKPQAPQNPVAVYGQLLQAQGLANQNKLFQQEFTDRAALNQAYQAATDPQTGVVDPNRLAAALAGGGMGRLLPQAQQGIQEFQKRGLELDKAQLELGQSRINAMSGALSSLLANPNPTRQDVIAKASQLIAQKVITPQAAAAFLSDIPADGAGLKAKLNELLISTLASQERLAALTPKVQLVDTGGAINPMDVNPLTNPGIVGQSIQKSLSPSDLAATVPGMIGNQPVNLTKAGQLAMGGVVPSAPALDKFGLTPEQSTQLVDYFDPVTKAIMQIPRGIALTRMMSSLPQAGGVGAGSQGVVSPAPSPGMMKTAPLGAPEAAGVAGTQSAKQGIDLQGLADQVPVRKAALQNMESALQNFTSGPGADWKLFAKSLVNANVAPIFDPQKIASQEEFTKQATQVALQQLQTLGTGTDEKLGSAIKANPSTALSKLGNQQIMQLLKGNEDAIAAKNQAWQEWLTQGNGPESYGKFSTAFNKQFDPRAFQAAYMTPDERKKLVDSMGERDRATFRNNFNLAVQRGWIPDIRGQ